MLYLDYSRPEGQWLPNVHGGRENLDAVAFLQEMNATVYRNHPGVVTIAEESTAWPGVSRPTHLGGLGFGFKWNMGWMHDTLDYAGRDPIYRGYHHNQMTFSLMYAFSENFVLPLSATTRSCTARARCGRACPATPGTRRPNLRALLAYMWAHPGKQLLFQGGEFGQEREWSESRSLDWHLLDDPLHGGIKTLVGDLNRAYRATPALWTKDATPEGFSWIDANDASGNVLSFLRHGVDADGKPTVLACIANFSGSPKPDYRVGLPFAGRWREVLNTDAQIYGGSGVGNLGAVEAERSMWHGRPASAVLQLPPAGVLWLVPEPGAGAVRRRAAAAAPAAPAPAAEAPPAETPAAGAADEPDLAAEVPTSDAPERTPAPEPSPSESTGDPDLDAEVPASDAPERPSSVAGPAAVSSGTSAPVTRPATGPAAADATPSDPPAATGAADPAPASQNGLHPAAPDTASWEAAPWSSARAGDTLPPAAPSPDATDTGELPTVSGTGETVPDNAVPDSPPPGADSVLGAGPATPVTEDAPDEAPPTPAAGSVAQSDTARSEDTGSAAGSSGAERTDDDSSTAQ